MRLPRLDPFGLRGFGTPKSAKKSATPAAPEKPAQQAFHAVSIATGWPSCAAARELEGRSFLSGEAPKLPLPGCDQGACDCAYQHHADRRDGPRRDAELGLPGMGFQPTEERRDRADRRTEQGATATHPPLNYFEHATSAFRLADFDGTNKRSK